MEERRLVVLGHTRSSWAAFLSNYHNWPKGRSGYEMYADWWIAENTPLGKALK